MELAARAEIARLIASLPSARRTRGRSTRPPMFDPLDYSGDDGGHARVARSAAHRVPPDRRQHDLRSGARWTPWSGDGRRPRPGGRRGDRRLAAAAAAAAETAADRRLNIRASDEAMRLADNVPTDLVFEAFQALVAALARALVDRCGCDARLLPTVEAIWAPPRDGAAAGDTLARGAVPQLLGEAQVSRMSAGAPCGARAADGARAPPRRLRRRGSPCAPPTIAWSRNGRVPLMEAHTTIDATLAPAPTADAAAGSSTRRRRQSGRARRAPLRPGARRLRAFAPGRRPAGSTAAPDGGRPRAARPAAAAAAARDGAPSGARPHAAGWAAGRRRAPCGEAAARRWRRRRRPD